jgi:hypothetical protein
MHMLFLGNPGTGKTTVARLVARMLKSLGVLKTGQLIEVTRKARMSGGGAGLVARKGSGEGWVGGSADAVGMSRGGMLEVGWVSHLDRRLNPPRWRALAPSGGELRPRLPLDRFGIGPDDCLPPLLVRRT